MKTHNHTNYLDEFSKVVYNEFYFFLQKFILEGVKNKEIRDNLSWQLELQSSMECMLQYLKVLKQELLKRPLKLMAGLKSSLWDAIKS